jgi:hypothetical protein
VRCVLPNASEHRTDTYTVLRQKFMADAFRGRRVRLAGHLRVADVAGPVGLWMQISGSAAQAMPSVDRMLINTPAGRVN